MNVNDWIMVNFMSQKDKMHRYVGPIVETANVEKEFVSYVAKFAKKRDEKTYQMV